jgi:putative glutamine amidotransferase
VTAPLIGITGRRLQSSLIRTSDERFGAANVDVFFSDFARHIGAAGGLPVLLPFESTDVRCVSRLDGLVVTGGQDVHPRHFRVDAPADRQPEGDPRASFYAVDDERDVYELTLLIASINAGLPVLGVCRGHQLLNVALGGTLIEDLPDSGIGHMAAVGPYSDAVHEVTLQPGSIVADIYDGSVSVSSWHHQAVDTVAPHLVVTGRAGDGVIEAIELPGRPVLGVQWHPEWHAEPDPIFDWLVHTCMSAAGRPPVLDALESPRQHQPIQRPRTDDHYK